MHFTKFTLAILAPVLAIAAPTPEDIEIQNVTERAALPSGQRQVNLYTGIGCSSSSFTYTKSNFGCGGTCFSFNQNLESIYLEYGGGNTKPTADCFVSDDCSGKVATHAGIWKGYTDGCTNFNQALQSCYFYYNC